VDRRHEDDLDTNVAPISIGTALSSVTGSLAAQLRFEDLPAKLVEFRKDQFIDTLGDAVAATRFDFARRARTGLSGFAENGRCSVIGMPDRLPLKDSARKLVDDVEFGLSRKRTEALLDVLLNIKWYSGAQIARAVSAQSPG